MNRACPDRSCPGVVCDGGYPHCGENRRNRLPDNRLPAHKRGYDKRWQRIRNAMLASEPLCRHCAERGRLTAAVLVDHIVPLPLGTHSVDNLQPLCASCHTVKTVAEAFRQGITPFKSWQVASWNRRGCLAHAAANFVDFEIETISV